MPFLRLHRLDTISVRWQVWALYVGLLCAILIGLGVILDIQIDQRLVSVITDHATSQARQIIDRELNHPAPPKPPKSAAIPPSDLTRVADALVREMNASDLHVVVYGPEGTVVESGEATDTTNPWPSPEIPDVQRVLSGAPTQQIVVAGARRVALILLPIGGPLNPRIGVVSLGVSLETPDAAVARIRSAVILGAMGAAILGALVGVPLTRALMSPLDRVVRAAERVTSGELTVRAGLDGRRDEFGQLGNAFDRMLDRLNASLAAQRRFVADASHELKSPLTGIGGMMEVLEGLDPSDEVTRQRAVLAISRETRRMQRLVADLLTLSHLDAGLGQRRDPVDLAAVVGEVVENRLLLGGSAIRLEIKAHPIVLGDADSIVRLVRNMVDNSVVATVGSGDICVTVESDARFAIIRVADTGVGIPADALPRLFERFYRSDSSRARETGGAGLGLAIAQAIAVAHGGSIEATSDGPGRGAVFAVRLRQAG